MHFTWKNIVKKCKNMQQNVFKQAKITCVGMKILQTKKSFRREFKRQLRLAIVAAIGFTVAFAWRNAVYDTFQNWIARILDVTPQHYTTETYTALGITLFGVLAIFITSRILRE
jgi:hypothetical protein